VATAVSIPLTAYAATGTDRASVARAAPLAQAGDRERPPIAHPSAHPAAPHTTSPSIFAHASTVSASPHASGASSTGHGSGVTPSVLGPPALNRQPTPETT
jgi:hypothetical protein